jgi:hypothetical protein
MNETLSIIIPIVILFGCIFGFVRFINYIRTRSYTSTPPVLKKKVEPYLKGVPYQSTGIVGNGFSGKLKVRRNSGMSWFIGHSFR